MFFVSYSYSYTLNQYSDWLLAGEHYMIILYIVPCMGSIIFVSNTLQLQLLCIGPITITITITLEYHHRYYNYYYL